MEDHRRGGTGDAAEAGGVGPGARADDEDVKGREDAEGGTAEDEEDEEDKEVEGDDEDDEDEKDAESPADEGGKAGEADKADGAGEGVGEGAGEPCAWLYTECRRECLSPSPICCSAWVCSKASSPNSDGPRRCTRCLSGCDSAEATAAGRNPPLQSPLA